MNRPELTFEEFTAMPMQYIFGLTHDKYAARRYINEDLGIVKEVVTKRKRAGDPYGGWKEPEVCFFMTDDPKDVWYPNVAMLYEAYMRKVCGEET